MIFEKVSVVVVSLSLIFFDSESEDSELSTEISTDSEREITKYLALN